MNDIAPTLSNGYHRAMSSEGSGRGRGSGEPRKARRAPTTDTRRRDPQDSRERLLSAALDEFSARGYAGARVSAIAARAGLNAQLITYHFGGKEGLYRALHEQWLEQEEGLVEPGARLEDLIVAYLEVCFADQRRPRLLLWDGLDDQIDAREQAVGNDTEDLSDLERRQAEGEIAADLDPGLYQLAIMGATLAPIAMPHVVRRITGLDPADPTFQERYAEHLRRIVRHLSGDNDRG
jgi:AcrR family transcriptional regulator